MSYYTEFKFRSKLRPDTPKSVIDLLKRVLVDRDLGIDNALFKSEDVFIPEFAHDFFKCERWYMLFLSTNFDENLVGASKFSESPYILQIHSEFKNYDSEIDHFIDWVTPYVIGRKKKQYVGYRKGEDDRQQINIYIHRNRQELKNDNNHNKAPVL